MLSSLLEHDLVRQLMLGTYDPQLIDGQLDALREELTKDKNVNLQELAGLAALAPPTIQQHLQRFFLGNPSPPAVAAVEPQEYTTATQPQSDSAPGKLSLPLHTNHLAGRVSKPTAAQLGKRKFHHKLRKGCSTCKKRRVKCDEARPVCNKCLHMGITCGYVVDEEASAEPEFDLAKALKMPVLLPVGAMATPQYAAAAQVPRVTVDSSAAYSVSQTSPPGLHGSPLPPGLPTIEVKGGIAPTATVLLQDATSPIHKHHPQASARRHSGETPECGTPGHLLPNVSSTLLSGGMLGRVSPSPYSGMGDSGLNMTDLRLMHHYTTHVWPTITAAGISEEKIWSTDIPTLAFNFPFLMHSILAFSATHLSRTEEGLDQCITLHRGHALRLLRQAVLDMLLENTDALVALALILIMDALANALLPMKTLPKLVEASAWIFHVKGAATILTAVWPLDELSRFYKFISVDLGDLDDIGDITGDLVVASGGGEVQYTLLECFDEEIADMYPVEARLPYVITLAYLNKLHLGQYKKDFILRVFAFPALLDKEFLMLLMTGDICAMRIMRLYYKLLRSFTARMKDKVWFLEGMLKVLPVNVEEYAGGGGLHMMLDFLGGSGPPATTSPEKMALASDSLTSLLLANMGEAQGDQGAEAHVLADEAVAEVLNGSILMHEESGIPDIPWSNHEGYDVD